VAMGSGMLVGSVVLLLVLSGLAILNLAVWLRIAPVSVIGLPGLLKDADLFFFLVFFEFMIFTDVLVFILSLAYYDRYE